MSLPFKTEIIEIDGEDYRFYDNPFTEYLRQHPSMRVYFSRDFPSGRPIYEAIWKVEQGQLLMTGFYQSGSRRKKYHQLRHFFGSDAPKAAYWYSGTLRVFRGKELSFLTLSEYTGEVVIESGKVISCFIEKIQDDDPRISKSCAPELKASHPEMDFRLSEKTRQKLAKWLD
jgi:hypothetical protein